MLEVGYVTLKTTKSLYDFVDKDYIWCVPIPLCGVAIASSLLKSLSLPVIVKVSTFHSCLKVCLD